MPPADFLLETELRGTPPKSEGGCFLGTHLKVVGGSVEGSAPFLRKESSKFEGKILRKILQIYLFWLIGVGKG